MPHMHGEYLPQEQSVSQLLPPDLSSSGNQNRYGTVLELYQIEPSVKPAQASNETYVKRVWRRIPLPHSLPAAPEERQLLTPSTNWIFGRIFVGIESSNSFELAPLVLTRIT